MPLAASLPPHPMTFGHGIMPVRPSVGRVPPACGERATIKPNQIESMTDNDAKATTVHAVRVIWDNVYGTLVVIWVTIGDSD